MKHIFLILTLVIFSPLCFIHAQMSDPSATGIDLTASSNSPAPGQIVNITARSFSADINASKITWTVDGKMVQSGTGVTSLNIVAPALGKKHLITVTGVTPSGRTMISNITVTSGAIDIITETNGYVPPFFKGKVVPVYQNAVTTIAIPHISDSKGKEYDPKTLVYQWKKNGSVLESQSGYGRQAITIQGDIVPRDYTLEVNAWSQDGSGRAQVIVPISYNNPSAHFYVNDPLYGPLYNIEIGDTIRLGTKNETGIRVVPFGFNKPLDSIGNLILTWVINNTEHTELENNESITLRAPANTDGSSNVSLDITNSKDILQQANGNFVSTFTMTKPNSVTF